MIWPEAAAPFEVGIINLKVGDAACDGACARIYAALGKAGVDALYDDRDERPGAKFATMDLIGLPHQVIVGPKGLAEGKVEMKDRRTANRELVGVEAAIARLGADRVRPAIRGFRMTAAALDAPRPPRRPSPRGRFPPSNGWWRCAICARAAPRLDFGDRRLLLPRHRARRRRADRRHGGDERLSPRSDGQDDRPQRPHVPARRRYAADRLRRGDRAGRQGARRHAGAAAGRGPGVRLDAVRLVRRAGARRARGRLAKRLPGVAGTSRKARSTASTTAQGVAIGAQARRASEPARRRQDHADRAARRGDAVRRHAADEGLSRRGDLPDRHGELRRHLRLHAASRGAGLFQSRRPGQRHRGLRRRSRPHRRDARAHQPQPSSGR